MNVKVRICSRGEIREVTRRRIPQVGSHVKTPDGRRWLVLAVEFPVKYRVDAGSLFSPAA